MAAKIELSAQTRKEIGKRASRRLRKTDKVIGTVYGAHKAPTAIIVEHHKLLKAMENEAFYSSILTLNLDNTPEKVVIKALQRHPSRPRVQHVDFFRINPNEKLTMHIPLHFLGEAAAPGIKEGGVISRFMNEVGVRCLPADLPEYIEIDLSRLNMNDTVHLTDLKLPKGVELVDFMHGGDVEEHNKPVANLHMPHLIQEPIPTEAPVSAEVEAIRVSAETPAEAAPEGGKEAKKESKKE